MQKTHTEGITDDSVTVVQVMDALASALTLMVAGKHLQGCRFPLTKVEVCGCTRAVARAALNDYALVNSIRGSGNAHL